MDFQEDVSTRLVEWLEAQYLLGVSTVTTYVYTVAKNVQRVLDRYEKLGKLVQIPLTLPGHSPNLPLVRSQYIARNRQQKRRHELIPYNDCLYSTANVATVFNHFALHRLSPNVTGTIYVPEKLGLKLHYKATCPIEARKECDELQTDTVLDHSIDRFTDELSRRVNRALRELKLL
ncbi:hypothetical protein GCK32_011449 [Trichostrongylus colubriformis]|uniref:Glycosyltransferase family 92 protein n=1 Tax=Trichostrongylus colubriformis TaxID=6319 RepID=A0AAN8F6J1_TRICO